MPCGKRIMFGKISLRCRDCRVVTHPECRERCPLPCIPNMGGTPVKIGEVCQTPWHGSFLANLFDLQVYACLFHLCFSNTVMSVLFNKPMSRLVARACSQTTSQTRHLWFPHSWSIVSVRLSKEVCTRLVSVYKEMLITRGQPQVPIMFYVLALCSDTELYLRLHFDNVS